MRHEYFSNQLQTPEQRSGGWDGVEIKINHKLVIQICIIILQFVMKAEEMRDELDIDEDVDNLKRVWNEYKEPKKRTPKEPFAKTQAGTQTKVHPTQKQKPQKERKPKVVVSEQNMKETVRNPKLNPATVIEVITKPEKRHSDPIRNERNITAPNNFVMTNPEKQVVVGTESLKKQIIDKDYELSLLRVSNTHNEDKVRRLEGEIEQRDRSIDQLKARERYLTSQLSDLNSRDFNFNYGKVEYENYRQDSRRLLKMLKSTSEYRTFADFALDDDGVRFLINANHTVKTRLDAPADQTHFHFCTCNKAFIPEAALWVPEKAYEFGRDFLKDRKGQLSQTEIELLLYELNKLWREREKRILNHVHAMKANQVGKYKRKMRDMSSGNNRSKPSVRGEQ